MEISSLRAEIRKVEERFQQRLKEEQEKRQQAEAQCQQAAFQVEVLDTN